MKGYALWSHAVPSCNASRFLLAQSRQGFNEIRKSLTILLYRWEDMCCCYFLFDKSCNLNTDEKPWPESACCLYLLLISQIQGWLFWLSFTDIQSYVYIFCAAEQLCLPAGWQRTLPKEYQRWIWNALFMWNPRKPAEPMVRETLSSQWYCPPQPTLQPTACPTPDRYFARSLFLWRPRKMWGVKLKCPHGCEGGELTSRGIYQKTCPVFGVRGCYNLATEYLACSGNVVL